MYLSYKEEFSFCLFSCLVAKAAGGARAGSTILATETEPSPLVGG